MLKDSFFKLISVGTNESQEQEIKNKIVLSNFLAILLGFGVGLPFVIITYYHVPPVAIVPLLACIGLMFIPALNYFGLYLLAKVLLCLLILTIVPAYHGMLVSDGEPVLNASLLLSICFALLPFLIFRLKEWPVLAVFGIIALLEIMFFDKFTGWYDQPLDDSFLRNGFFMRLTSFMGVGGAFTAVLALLITQQRSQKESESLLNEMQSKQKELEGARQDMQNNLEQLQLAKAEEQKRQWSSEGQAAFARLLREHDDLKTMGDEFVSKIVKFLEANQAGFFTVKKEGDEPYLELLSCYAFNRKKFVEKRMNFGQGLLGQACLEKEYVHLTEIPDDYVQITSGLGDANPKSLLIIPFLYNEQVAGVLEIASFKKFEAHQIDFLLKLGEVVAATLSAHQVNDKTRELLMEAQESQEMLRAQEEEMRQNMEELAATQEDQQRKEQEYQEKINQLEEKLAQISLENE